jgi:hypothetical protein
LRFGLCFQQKLEKGRVGVRKIGSIPKIGISKSKSLTTKVTQEHKGSGSKGTSQPTRYFATLGRFI